MTPLLIFTVAAYLAGSIPTGIIVARLSGAPDPRQRGSGNIGATNLARTGGRKAGLLTLAGDAAKGALPVLLGLHCCPERPIVAAVAGLAAFLGHLYPVFLGFRGGKGVATSLGIFLVLAPKALLIGLLAFVLALALTRAVSAGSLAAAVVVPLGTLLLSYPRSYALTAAVMGILIIYRHRENIARLLAGRENRLF